MSRALILKRQFAAGLLIPPPAMLYALRTSATPAERGHFLDQYRQRQTQVAEVMKRLGLWSTMSRRERTFMRASPERVDEQTLRDVSWSMESLECLLWALGYVNSIPPYDIQADVHHLGLLPSEGLASLIRNATLRDAAAIEKARDDAQRWHWRSRTRQLMESGKPVHLPDGVTLIDIVRMSAEDAARDGLIEQPINGDYPIRGRAFSELTAEEWSEIQSIITERHKALNWLCGYAPGNRWHDTPTDT